jgi:hypothetical protein
MSLRLVYIIVISALAIMIQSAQTEPVRQLELKPLITSADLILVGKITAVIPGQSDVITMNGRDVNVIRMTAVLRVDEVFKGKVAKEILRFRFYVPEAPSSQIRTVPEGQYGIFFLRQHKGFVSVADLTYPYLRAIPGRHSQSDPLDSVTVALGQILISTDMPNDERIRALDGLVTARTDLSKQILVNAMNSSTGELQLLIAGGIVGSGNISGLPVVENALLQSKDIPKGLISFLGGSLAGLKDPKAIPSLIRLMVVKNPQVRVGIVSALRQTGSNAAVEPLARLLDDSDPLVRYYAVVGLGEITHQDEWTPSIDAFQENSKYYLSHWREWVAVNIH